MNDEIPEIDAIYLQRFSATGDGMQLELLRAIDGKPEGEPFAYFRANVGDTIRFVIDPVEGPVSITLAELECAIASAKRDVHSEEYYDRPDA